MGNGHRRDLSIHINVTFSHILSLYLLGNFSYFFVFCLNFSKSTFSKKITDNFCKQFGPRSGPTNVGPDLDPNYLTP